MTRNEIIERYCLLASEVWNARFDASTANDCFCQRGGLWDSKSYSDEDFRNGGEALEWIEKVVRGALVQAEAPQ
jgi:hypothetical protein